MPITRLPIISGVDVEAAGGGIVNKGSLSKNILYSHYVASGSQNALGGMESGRIYATQRPSLSLKGVASVNSIPPNGRGIVFWDAISAYVIVNNDTVYVGDYGGALGSKIDPGKEPVQLIELHSGYMVILDRENNKGWYILANTPTTVHAITDTDFPCNIPGKHLAGGGAMLDGYLFIMDTDGVIYNSDLNDPTSWNALDFIQSQRDVDKGIYLTKHHDNIVAIGGQSVEFYYDAGNAVGSPIQPRLDISYITGCMDYKSVFNVGNVIYFLGSERTGTVGLYMIDSFNLTRVSSDSIDAFFSDTIDRSNFDFNVTGATVGNHHLIFLTSLAPAATTPASWSPQYTLVYDSYTQTFVQFETTISTIKAFSVCGSTLRNSTKEEESTIMFFNGDYGVFNLTFFRQDTASVDPLYVEAGYLENQDDYVQNLGDEETASIEAELIIGETDLGSLTNKFIYRLGIVGTTTANSSDASPIYISWSDDHYRTFSPERAVDTGINKSLTRCGIWRRRAHKLRYTGTDVIRIEALEIDARASRYA